MTAVFDLGTMLGANTNDIKVQNIPCSELVPYFNHKFTLYTGERLDDMVESIRKNGILTPLIVQPIKNCKYEILIGHNRWNAAKLAGLKDVPCIVKQNLTEKEAEMYVAGNFSPEYGMERANAGMSEIPTDATVAATKDDDIDFNHIVGGAHTNDLGEEEFNKAIK